MAICGIANLDSRRNEEEFLIRGMVSALSLGESATCSRHAEPEVSLGVTSTLGTASLYSCEQLLVACDAELCNRAELRRSASLLSQPDTPAGLVAELYLRHGEEAVKKLDGVFSLAIWDRQAKSLLLARDRLGIKPLCYAEALSGFIFASSVRGILASQLVARQVNARGIADYLNFNAVPVPRTAYDGIFKLGPGEYLVWRKGQIRKSRYWQLQYTEEARGTTKDLGQELFSQLEESVRVTSQDLNGDRVGCFLSGGTDSSSIAGLLSRVRQETVHAFSIGFHEDRFNELDFAQIAARHFDLKHFERILGAREAFDLVPRIVDVFDEPFANASAIPTLACLEFAKRHDMSVLFAGDGGDELFGGNSRYRNHQVYQLYQRLPRNLRKLVEPALLSAPVRGGLIGKAKRYVLCSNLPIPERYSRWRLLQQFPSTQIFGPAMPSLNGDALSIVRDHYDAAAAQSELNRLMYVDINMTLGDEDIPKVVRTAELAGMRVRFPYLDYSLAEFSASLPAHLKVRGLEKRYLFKRATQGFLPPAILKKKKHGFGLPIGIWLKTDPNFRTMARDVLLSPKTYQRGYFQRQFVEKLFAGLEQDDTPYFGDLLWVFLMLELWHRKHVEKVTA